MTEIDALQVTKAFYMCTLLKSIIYDNTIGVYMFLYMCALNIHIYPVHDRVHVFYSQKKS